MIRVDDVYVRHILSAITDVFEFTKGLTKEDFLEDKKTNSVVVRQFEIIGEASKNISDDFKDKHKDIPWRQIIGMRDKLIHGYFGTDLEKVWEVIEDDLLMLKEKLEKIN